MQRKGRNFERLISPEETKLRQRNGFARLLGTQKGYGMEAHRVTRERLKAGAGHRHKTINRDSRFKFQAFYLFASFFSFKDLGTKNRQ